MMPLAGELVARSYPTAAATEGARRGPPPTGPPPGSRNEEYAADAHGVVLLRRAGYPKEMMIDALTWLMKTSGPDSSGFLATHPGTADRILALGKMP